MNSLIRIGLCMMLCFIASSKADDESSEQHRSSERCDMWEKVLSGEMKDRTVMLVEEGCSGFANGLRDSIDIVLPNGSRTTAFIYEDAGWNAAFYGHTAPTVAWLAHDRLRISFGAVAAIQKKLDKVGDLVIEYEIGHVLYK
jgi:hypothetical protein